jgi:hypothetical protein
MKTSPIILVVALLASAAPAPAENIVYPDDARVVNIVADCGAKGDGVTDDSDALEKALEIARGNIYFPNGTYLISRTIDWKGKINRIFAGQSRAGTIIRLADNAPGFGDPAKPRPMLRTGQPPAIRFRNSLRNLTIDTGLGNPGATGVEFYVNNEGAMREVTIRSGPDGKQPGAVGLSMTIDMIGPLLVRDVEVIGFNVGIKTNYDVSSVTLEDVTVRGQRECGLDNNRNLVFARRFTSINSVPAIRNGPADKLPVICLVDSNLIGEGEAATRAAIEQNTRHGILYLRNVEVSGYANAIRDIDPETTVEAGHIAEWCSDAPIMLFPSRAASLGLKPVELPKDEWDQDIKAWANIEKFGATHDDKSPDHEAIQKAIDSGAETVYLPGPAKENAKDSGYYVIGDTIHIRGNVKRILGMETFFSVSPELLEAPEKPLFILEEGAAPVVFISGLGRKLGQEYENPVLIHGAKRDLVISDCAGLMNLVHNGPGRLFADDAVGNCWKINKGAELYAWQLNVEGWPPAPKLVNDGGLVWILGLKTECEGPVIHTLNGGKTEILGGFFYTSRPNGQKLGQFLTENASCSVVAAAESSWTRAWGTEEPVVEVREGERRVMPLGGSVRRGGGTMMGMVCSYPHKPEGKAPGLPEVRIAETTAGSVSLECSAADPDGDLAGFVIRREGDLPVDSMASPAWSPRRWGDQASREGNIRGRVKQGERFVERRLAPEKSYRFYVAAYDRFNNRSEEVPVDVSTPPDRVAPSAPAVWAPEILFRKVVVRWKASEDEIGVTGYRLVRSEGEGNETPLAEVAHGEKYEFVDDNVQRGRSYTYKVIARDAAGNESRPGAVQAAVPQTPPDTVTIQLENPHAKIDLHRAAGGSVFGNLTPGTWALYRDVDTGFDGKPFEALTIRYAAKTEERHPLLIIDVYLDPEIYEKTIFRGPKKQEQVIKDIRGGTWIGRFVLPETGSWEKFAEATIPVAIPEAKASSIAFKVRDARGSLDLLRFGRFADENAARAAREANEAALIKFPLQEESAIEASP